MTEQLMLNKQKTIREIEAGMVNVVQSPQDRGVVEMIVARPTSDERVVLDVGKFTLAEGLVGDNWSTRGSRHTEDGRAHPEMQVTLINGRYLDLVADGRERWPLAGDQLIVDLDLGMENLATGQRLRIGEVLFAVTSAPHNGCKKFKARFGLDAMRFTGAPAHKEQRLRGVYVQVIEPGIIRVGDVVKKI